MRLSVLALAAFALAACATPPQPGPAAPVEEKPLYDRLGGEKSVAAVLDAFIANVLADARVNAKFDGFDAKRFREKLNEFVCAASGGGCEYSGKSMKASHENIPISKADFDAVVEDLIKALDQYNVPQKEKDELLGLLGPTAKDIVNSPAR